MLWGVSMRMSVDLWQTLSRLAVIGVIGGLAGACSETGRFAGNPFSDPFAGSAKAGEPAMTGSVGEPTRTVQAKPLAAPQATARISPAAPVDNTPASASAQKFAGASSRPSGPSGWSAQGGTTVMVQNGETLNTIANRYGIPGSAILQANNLSSANQVGPGKRIVIPVYNAAGLAPTKVASLPDKSSDLPKFRLAEGAKPAGRAEPAQKAEPAAKAEVKERIRPGQTAKAAQVKPEAKAAAARLPDPKPVKTAAKPEPVKTAAKAEPVKAAKVEAPKVEKAKPVQVAKAEIAPAKIERAASIAPVQAAAPQAAPAKPAPEVTQTASLSAAPAEKATLGYRWPARGRVISGFGGNGNEGINIAVPEGTPVKAAEDGTVAYAGAEVKGYGKLVLIRHDNGHVSAYAHNGELGVKPGEKVKRGQTIAKSGQSGNVTSPQLHFEIRKGSTPIDPMPHLAGG